MLPRPPRARLFPYTTLFRSAGTGAVRAGAAHRRRGHAGVPGSAAGGAVEPGTDRKSTRLNSSHVAISYAVFCLKKRTFGDDLITNLARHCVRNNVKTPPEKI